MKLEGRLGGKLSIPDMASKWAQAMAPCSEQKHLPRYSSRNPHISFASCDASAPDRWTIPTACACHQTRIHLICHEMVPLGGRCFCEINEYLEKARNLSIEYPRLGQRDINLKQSRNHCHCSSQLVISVSEKERNAPFR
jgi:hypothetical protein